jgi:lysophospholipase L1-like esterase
VRKVALIGDSLTRGWGIASDLSYPRLVESALNRDSGQKFEFINFSVSGYRATQLFATAMDVAPAYHPNLYIVPFTILAAGPEWASHVLDLLDEGRDLRYDFLKDVVRRSGIQPGDSRAVAKRKIAPYQAEVLHQILVRLKAAADKQGADVLAVLLPAVESPGLVPLRFDTVRQALKGTGIPVMDMLDCFDDVDDLETMRIHWYDAHPNIAGHEKMATEFLAKAKAQPEVWRALIGGKQ